MGEVVETYDMRFKSPSCSLICGPSQSGKTVLAGRIVGNRRILFDTPPVRVVYYYHIWQEIYDTMLRDGIIDECKEGLPDEQDIHQLGEHASSGGSLIVIDDQLLNISNTTASLFSVFSHHLAISTLFLTQTLFSKNPLLRHLSLNSQYLWDGIRQILLKIR
jgi:hypothetical protein